MKRVLKIKTKKLTESQVGDDLGYMGDTAIKDKIDRRISRVCRTAEILRQTAKDARANGNEDQALELEERANELEEWADIENNKYRTNDEQEPSEQDEPDDAKDGEDSESEEEGENEDSDDGDDSEDSEDSKNNSNNKNNKQNSSDNESDDGEDDGEDEGEDSASGSKDDGDDEGDDGSDDEGEGSDDGEDGEEDESDDEGDDGSDDGNDDDDGEDDHESETETIDNPFEEDPRYANTAEPDEEGKKNKQKNAKDEFEAMKAILKTLRGGEKAGAAKGLDDLLKDYASKQESLKEAFIPITKDITEISDDEFEDILDDALNKITDIKPIKIITDRESHIKEIERENDDINAINELEAEDRDYTKDEREKYKQGQREIAKYSSTAKSASGSEAFKKMLRQAIKLQVENSEEEDSSWGEINRRHQDDDIIAPGARIDDKKKKEAISIKMYLDCSGSFKRDDIKKEEAFLAVVNDFVKQGKVKVEPIVYFADYLHSTQAAARKDLGTSAWDDMVKDMKKSRPDNVIIITDRDMNLQAAVNPDTYTARGGVWYIWKGMDSPEMLKRVRGLRGTKEFWLT